MGVEAVQEAESFAKLLGVSPEQLWACRAANSITIVPSVRMLHTDSDLDSDSEDDNDSIYGEEENDAEELQCLIDAEENTTDSHTCQQDERSLMLTYTSLAITANDMTKM